MGIEWRLLNPQKKEFFELGKGCCWCAAGQGDPNDPTDFDLAYLAEPALLPQRLLNFMHASGWDVGWDVEEDAKYAKEWARRLLEFVGDCPVELLTIHCDDDDSYEGIPVVCGRYTGDAKLLGYTKYV